MNPHIGRSDARRSKILVLVFVTVLLVLGAAGTVVVHAHADDYMHCQCGGG